jgi:hypothetical protein
MFHNPDGNDNLKQGGLFKNFILSFWAIITILFSA